MNLKRIPRNQLTLPNKKDLHAPRPDEQQLLLANPSKSIGASASPRLIEQGGLVETTTGALTKEQLISRAKHHIGIGEISRNDSFRAAADDIACACNQGMKQREAAEGIGKSAAWVNRLLKWRESGCVGAPFADKVVQGVNNDPAAPEPLSIEPAAPTILAETNAITTGVEGAVNAAAATAPATKMLSAACASDYHLPEELNRQDPERAYQRLVEQWSSIPFRDLLLASPKAAQIRFLRDVLLPEVVGPQALELLASGDRSAG